MRCFSEAVRVSVSPTAVGIESFPKIMVHYNTDPNAIDDELRVDIIMRIIPGKISEM